MNQKAKKSFLSNMNSLKKDINQFVKEHNIKEVQATVKKMVLQAEKDLKKYVDKDISVLKRKFAQEKRQIEKLLQKTIDAEVKRAKNFLEKQKKEITKLQKTLDKLGEAAKKATKKKVSKKKVSKKKATKKVTKKKASKKVVKKKATSKKKV